jgi:formate hydrogenlyase subunit 3/multisubunit Na+/H+ antiporter MnhD subunit
MTSLNTGTLLLLAAAGWPAILAALWFIAPFRRRAGVLPATAALPALLLAAWGDVELAVHVPGVFTAMTLGTDDVGRTFLMLTALLWSAGGVYAVSYMREDPRRDVFTGFMLAAAAGNIGVTIAQDGLSFYLFFALLTFTGYGLVAHTRSPDALRAGRAYITLAVIGEGLLLAAMLSLAAITPALRFDEMAGSYALAAAPIMAAALAAGGFAVKAGLFPLHLWLPLAHPVAPTPASALLSGAMIKAGVLGWLRFLPLGAASYETVGVAMMTLGGAGALYAAVVGITQTDAKTVLAYSSVSQMGFVAMGVGAALLVPDSAPALVLAVTVYAIHHALAKAALFLAVGTVPAAPRWPWLAAVALPCLALAGAPLTSGALAKAALKTGLGGLPGAWPAHIDLLLGAAAVGTTLLMARFLAVLPQATRHNGAPDALRLAPWSLLVALSAAAAFWLPHASTPFEELPFATGAGYIAAALWPIALGVILALAGVRIAARSPAFREVRVPAGDIFTLLERGFAGLWQAGRRAADVPLGEAARRAADWPRRRIENGIDAAAGLDARLASGPLLGVVMALVGLALYAVIGRG